MPIGDPRDWFLYPTLSHTHDLLRTCVYCVMGATPMSAMSSNLPGGVKQNYFKHQSIRKWSPRGGGGGGGVLWYFQTYVGSGHFWGLKFWISIFLGGFRKMNIFLGMTILWIFICDHHKIGLYLGVIFMHFGSFLKMKVQNGGYSDIFIHTFIHKFQYFFGFSEKINIFGGMKISWIFICGHLKIGLYLGVIFMHLWSFLKVKVQNGGYFFGLLKFQIFFGVLEILDIFCCTADAGPEPTCEEKMRVPPSPPPLGVESDVLPIVIVQILSCHDFSVSFEHISILQLHATITTDAKSVIPGHFIFIDVHQHRLSPIDISWIKKFMWEF